MTINDKHGDHMHDDTQARDESRRGFLKTNLGRVLLASGIYAGVSGVGGTAYAGTHTNIGIHANEKAGLAHVNKVVHTNSCSHRNEMAHINHAEHTNNNTGECGAHVNSTAAHQNTEFHVNSGCS